VVAAPVQLAALDVDGPFIRQGRQFVGIGQTGSEEAVLVGELGEHRGEGIVGWHQIAQQLFELGRIGVGHRAQWIERGQDDAFFVGGQIDIGNRDGRFTPGHR
jgi:hypothetical protein